MESLSVCSQIFDDLLQITDHLDVLPRFGLLQGNAVVDVVVDIDAFSVFQRLDNGVQLLCRRRAWVVFSTMEITVARCP